MLIALAKTLKEIVAWRVVLDILFTGTLLFFFYRTLRRLGTWKILTGLAIAVLFFAVARILELTGIIWIYSNLSQVAIIALIVIFQPELRKLFERAASLGRKKKGKEGMDLAVLIVDAIFTLAQQKRGAMIVFPGKEPITEWVTGGIYLDGEPSFPLMMSIFDPHSPGHDGALIVENGRLTSFGVHLPLSKKGALSEQLGTRHHAAMGLSELCDALIVAVSEERGTVTVFSGGRMRGVPDRNALNSWIVSHWKNTLSYGLPGLGPRRTWGLLREVTLSLLLATVFWFAVVFGQAERLERVLSVPIEYVATPEYIALVGDKPTEVKLHLAGPRSDLNELSLSQLAVRIDLSKAEPGKQTFVVTEQDLRLPKRVKLLDARPSVLVLNFREISEKEVTVKPQLVGRLPGDLEIESVKVNPEKVLILSPGREGSKEERSVMTTPIYLETIRERTTLFCKIIAPPSLQPAAGRWPDVEVEIAVRPRKGQQSR